MARQAAVGKRPRRRKRQDVAGKARFRRQAAQVVRGGLDLAVAGDHHQQRRVRQQQREQQAGRAAGTREVQPSRGAETLPRGRDGSRRGDAVGPVRHGCRIRSRIFVVERPSTSGTRTTRPPAASTSSRPTIWSAQSAPFTSTSRERPITCSGVGSS